MKSFYVAVSIALALFSFGCKTKVQSDCVAKPNPNCACAMIYQPVCGCDGKTYGNACEAACNGIKVVSEGECK